ncbi:MAG: hypothetical protein QMC85_06870 [Methanocellales archaeon]|nr:hypothetical protein [Methanocellales archaeon]
MRELPLLITVTYICYNYMLYYGVGIVQGKSKKNWELARGEPKEVLDKTNVREGDEIIVKGVEKVKVEEMFGIWKGLPPFKHVSEDHEF